MGIVGRALQGILQLHFGRTHIPFLEIQLRTLEKCCRRGHHRVRCPIGQSHELQEKRAAKQQEGDESGDWIPRESENQIRIFSRATAVCATAFFVSSLTLAYLSSQRSDAPTSLLEGAPLVEESGTEAPASAEDMPLPDAGLPTLDPADEAAAPSSTDDELPTLDEPAPSGDEGQ